MLQVYLSYTDICPYRLSTNPCLLSHFTEFPPLNLGQLEQAAQDLYVEDDLTLPSLVNTAYPYNILCLKMSRMEAAVASLTAASSNLSYIATDVTSRRSLATTAWLKSASEVLSSLPSSIDEDIKLLSALLDFQSDRLLDTQCESLDVVTMRNPRYEMAIQARIEHKSILLSIIQILKNYEWGKSV